MSDHTDSDTETARLQNGKNPTKIDKSTTLLGNGRSVKSMTEKLETSLTMGSGLQINGQRSEKDDQTDLDVTNKDVTYKNSPSVCTIYIETVEDKIEKFKIAHGRKFRLVAKCMALLAYIIYFVYCLCYRFGDEGSITLIILTAILFTVITYRLQKNRAVKKSRCSGVRLPFSVTPRCRVFIRYGLYVLAVVGLGIYLCLEVFQHNPQNAQSLLGIVVIVVVCFLLSSKPSRVNWHPIFWGFIIQFCFATLTLRTDAGYRTFQWLGDALQRLLWFHKKGAAFVLGVNYSNMGLGFLSAGAMIFFGAVMGVFTHWGVIDFIVVKGGHVLSLAMETGPVESVVAIANIFIGLSQAPLMVRPYLPTLSYSELGALMTCGYASVSGDIMVLFIAFGAPANHLLTAAIISAPAALAIAKLLVPEAQIVDISKQRGVSMGDGVKSQNALSAAADGAMMAVKLVVNSMANMLAFVSLLGLIDAILVWFGERAGIQGLTFDAICGYALYPLAFVMGAAPEDCSRVGSLIGVKLFATPMVGYADLGKIIENRHVLEDYINNSNGTWHWEGTDVILDATNTTLVHGFMSERSEVIATYAMCGFSAFTAIGISIGSLTPLCPSRKSDIIKLVPAAFFGGNVASFATGAVAGLLHRNH